MNKLILILKSSAAKSILLSVLFGLAFATNGFADADSCAANSANRQLDYWLGDWKIGAEGSSGNAHSTVSLSLDKCLVVENWDGGRGDPNFDGASRWPTFDSTSRERFEIAHVGLRPVSERVRTLETIMRSIAAKQN